MTRSTQNELPRCVAATPAELADCCADLAQQPLIGFDTEFIGEDTYHPRLCLVQVATPERLYLIDPLSAGPLEQFWELVADPRRTSVVHAGREEIRLCRLGCGKPPGKLFDVQLAAGLVGYGYPTGHANLVHSALRITVSKAETLTDWARRPLTSHQVRYAYDDIRFLLALHQKLQKKLVHLNRLSWAEEEFAALTRRSMNEEPTNQEPWRKLRGLGALNRRQLAIVRELFQWRDEKAERQNRPCRGVMRDDILVEIARREPKSERDMTVMRGMTKSDVPDLLAAIVRAAAAPKESWPEAVERDNDPPQVGMISSLLMGVLGNFCAQEKLTQSLAATAQDIKLLVRSRLLNEPLDPASNLCRGWRRHFVYPVLDDVLNGKRAVRVASVSQTAPFEIVEPNSTA